MSASANTTSQERWDVLDTLRALAVAGVFCVHFSGLYIGDYVDTGTLGVRLFFVLSGFLVTGLLLRDRRQIEAGRLRRGRAIVSFYLRRLFRIAPAYYLSLALAWALSLEDMRDSWPWHVSYLSNQHIIALGRWPGVLGHLWTLSLEFQFYLVWPLALIFLPRRSLPWLVFACILLGPASRWASPSWGVSTELAHLVTTGSLDFFGCGALVAWWRDRKSPGHAAGILAARALPWLIAASVLLALRRFNPADSGALRAIGGLVMACAFASLMAVCTRPSPPAWARWLGERKLLVRIGAISYGLYLFHNLMHWAAPRVCLRLFDDSYPDAPPLYPSVLIALSFVSALTSWFLVEAPLNRFARRFATTS